MKGANIISAFSIVSLYLLCINAFEINLKEKEEICLTKKNTTAEKCALKHDLSEMISLLTGMKNELTRLNDEVVMIKEMLNDTELCDHGRNGKNVYDSCKDVLSSASSAHSGVYRIKTDTLMRYSNVYCQMSTLGGCSGGGWTLAMKIDGNKETFSYSSPYWSNKKSFSPNDGKVGFDNMETKLATYWSTPFTQLCVGMRVGDAVQFIPINYSANSLYDLLASGKYVSTSLPYNTWKSLYRDSSLQRGCGRQGFNVVAGDQYHARARIGLIRNNQNDCATADSFIGFGGSEASRRRYCGKRNIVNSCGNSAYCSPDNGDKEIRAMGYIFIR